jgi:hypothetical protein
MSGRAGGSAMTIEATRTFDTTAHYPSIDAGDLH